MSDLWNSTVRFLAREALLLDNKDWDHWLGLYDANAEYWVPAWTDGGELTDDPKRQVSLIYYGNRSGLEDRVYRLRSGKSAASNLEVRTSHQSQLLEVNEDGGLIKARSNWTTHALINNEIAVFFGWAEYVLRSVDDSCLILHKKTALLNDRPDTVLDFYMI